MLTRIEVKKLVQIRIYTLKMVVTRRGRFTCHIIEKENVKDKYTLINIFHVSDNCKNEYLKMKMRLMEVRRKIQKAKSKEYKPKLSTIKET